MVVGRLITWEKRNSHWRGRMASPQSGDTADLRQSIYRHRYRNVFIVDLYLGVNLFCI